MSETRTSRIGEIIENRRRLVLTAILLLNLIIRLLVYFKTTLFSFSDYRVYLEGIERIQTVGIIPLVADNFLFAISYLGYYAKYIIGNIDFFFLINCLLGTLTTLILALLVMRITKNKLAGLLTVFLLTCYTEFIVFSSVFYTPLILIFLISIFISLLWHYFVSNNGVSNSFVIISLITIFLTTFFFKQELLFLPLFFLITGFFFIRRDKGYSIKLFVLSFLLLTFSFLLQISGLLTKPEGNVISNDFIFFGHTDYGGDGGEGSFVYPENEVRYKTALSNYLETNKISNPSTTDINSFHWQEICKFITQHPLKWVGLQVTKFFRTFGVVPETTSFKVLYTGLLNGNLWLTSFIVVAPVALIILMFIVFFNFKAIKHLTEHRLPITDHPSSTLQPSFANASNGKARNPQPATNKHFLYIYLLLFIYYLLATVFFGQYQERYRMPLIVLFIIPTLSYFIATFDWTDFFKRRALIIKGFVVILFLVVWVFQAEKAISNKERLNNAIESVVR